MADYKDIKYNVDYSDTSGAGGLVKITSIHQAQNDNDAGSDTFDFTTGIDDTYDVYVFELSGMIPHGTVQLSFQVDTGTNTNYNITNTSMVLSWYHGHDGAAGAGGHGGPTDNDTGFIKFTPPQKGSGDPGDFQTRGAQGGYLYLFNPSSSTFEKHWMAKMSGTGAAGATQYVEVYESAGYFQTTTAITRVRFKYSTGKIDGGRITMFGLAK
tara:strand:+ start:483 stop:1118 length:636 start_codon:yes stop_codon:yes gene_type:complete